MANEYSSGQKTISKEGESTLGLLKSNQMFLRNKDTVESRNLNIVHIIAEKNT